ncbi:multicomponent K+:H+ antiporter subunit G [Devosia enhydra]|uniref:Multicomponent K+:H+ antiporter subunit G n=1 Tax=Devosia enhydra TaxID=665118 RepID=A0A1K2HZY4_9HYPH|nr:monovalent cation/H(+) antiporter subunit G [Devosia enhydra]SFZ85690.1 multicomponent K+:H+ antiporter subunit G [Devosia enhydra]
MIANLPLWLSILVSAAVVLGSALTLAGCFGLVRLPTFYLRIHAPTMGTSLGGGLILLGSALYFSLTQGRVVFHELAIFVFVTVTTPVTLMLLARATLFRDRVEGGSAVPPSFRKPEPLATEAEMQTGIVETKAD